MQLYMDKIICATFLQYLDQPAMIQIHDLKSFFYII